MISSMRLMNSGRKAPFNAFSILSCDSRSSSEALRLEEAQSASLSHVFGAQVRGHDQNRIAEIHHVALTICHAAVVQNLQQRVPDFGMRLLDLIEQHDAIGASADCFC